MHLVRGIRQRPLTFARLPFAQNRPPSILSLLEFGILGLEDVVFWIDMIVEAMNRRVDQEKRSDGEGEVARLEKPLPVSPYSDIYAQ